MGAIDKIRHAAERGKILTTLQEEYGGRMTRVADLHGALDLQGSPMTGESLQFSLEYLAEEGYIKITRACETPGWRGDRANTAAPDSIVLAKLTPLGIRLIDGDAAANAGVRF